MTKTRTGALEEDEQGSHCLTCGPNVAVDEDGCCASCGRDAMWYAGQDCRCSDFDDGPCPQCLHDGGDGQPMTDQQPPKPNDRRPIHEAIIDDIRARAEVGLVRYGTHLQAGNGRDSLRDAYEEQLDRLQYHRQWMEERKELVEVLAAIVSNLAPAETDRPLWGIAKQLVGRYRAMGVL